MNTGALRLGLIGAGRWGGVYIKTLKNLPGVNLHRLASGNPASRALVADDCIIDEDWRAVATAGDVDGVIVATPPPLHAEMAAAAIAAGIPVLIEKPLTMDAAQARALLQLARQKAAIVAVDHIHLFHPAYEELKKQGLGLGAIRSIRGVGGDWGPFRPDVPVLWDRASHDVAMCLDLTGENPGSLSATRRERRRTPDGIGETVEIELNFPGGASAHIEAGNLMERKKRRLVVQYDSETLTYDDVGGGAVAKAPLDRVLETFAGAIRRGESDLAGLELGVRVVEVLAACDAALRDGGKLLNSG